MGYVGIESIKQAYANELISNNRVDDAKAIVSEKTEEPIFSGYNVHPESEPSLNDMNNALTDIYIDFIALRKETIAAANKFNDLMASIKTRLEAVDEQLLAEEERIMDLNAICGNYKDFSTVTTLTKDMVTGSFNAFDNRTFSCPGSTRTIKGKVEQVNGNGYEGNAYVYSNGEYVQKSMDTSSQQYMVDNSLLTAYEYSRLTVNKKEKVYPKDANFDTEEAICSIIISGSEDFTGVNITSDINTMIVKDVLISDDGGTYESTMNKSSIAIKNMSDKYIDGKYAYGSGVIEFPSTKYLKLVLQSNGVTSDKMAFEWVDAEHSTADKQVTVTTQLNTAKRHVIRVNNIELLKGQYDGAATLVTKELIFNPVKSIAIFANEYVPSYFSSDSEYFEYILTVNGIDHSIVPINSDKNGTKVIRFIDHTSSDTYIEHINESIKSAKLTVKFYSPGSSYTPYLSNLKVCLGEVDSTNG